MLDSKFKQLMELFSAAAGNNQINLEEIFTQSLAFFDELNAQLKNGSPEEKKEALRMMSEMYTQMMMLTKRICERTGLSEEQLAAFAENPSNYSKEQWQLMQQSREAMKETGQKLTQSLEELAPPRPPSDSKEKKSAHHPKKPKKSQWMKS